MPTPRLQMVADGSPLHVAQRSTINAKEAWTLVHFSLVCKLHCYSSLLPLNRSSDCDGRLKRKPGRKSVCSTKPEAQGKSWRRRNFNASASKLKERKEHVPEKFEVPSVAECPVKVRRYIRPFCRETEMKSSGTPRTVQRRCRRNRKPANTLYTMLFEVDSSARTIGTPVQKCTEQCCRSPSAHRTPYQRLKTLNEYHLGGTALLLVGR
jgi:hypothetical protein